MTTTVSTPIVDADLLALMEREIRAQAGSVCNAIVVRRAHPTYVTKTNIRNDYQRMEGMIGLYMVATGQAFHAAVPGIATFAEANTTTLVVEARERVKGL